MTGNDGVAMALALPHRPFSQIKAQACFAHFRVRTVTTEASTGQNRLDILIEIEASGDVSLPAVATDCRSNSEGEKNDNRAFQSANERKHSEDRTRAGWRRQLTQPWPMYPWPLYRR